MKPQHQHTSSTAFVLKLSSDHRHKSNTVVAGCTKRSTANPQQVHSKYTSLPSDSRVMAQHWHYSKHHQYRLYSIQILLQCPSCMLIGPSRGYTRSTSLAL
jgi:hypothetical protein